MRPLLAAAVLALTTAGCAASGPSQAVTTSTVAETASPGQPSMPSRSRAEIAYLKALNDAPATNADADMELDEDAYLDDGQKICGQADDDLAGLVETGIDVRESEGVVYRAALTKLCPKHRKVWGMVSAGVNDGRHTVGGKGVRAGTYRTLRKPVTDCYWERSTPGGRIVDNQLVNNAPKGIQVTLLAGEGFTSRDCGPWIRA